MTTTEKPLHLRQAEGLRALADMIEQNPAVAPMMASTLPRMLVSVGHLGDAAEELLAFLRAGGSAARKNYDSTNWMAVDVEFGDAVGLYVYVSRDAVCERVVTGTETVTKLVPDPDAPLVETTEEVEQVEWRCSSLLAAEKASAVAS